ncbi:hypothetical protein RLW55_18540 [Hyphomicrobium sp. B1]|uniref:hypothetical protein n=1 Tax=unclassified Hyphomicrobium TaxID=2619925 RepID=UPI00391C3C17
MRKYIGLAAALVSALPLMTFATSADAGGRHYHGGYHHGWHGRYGRGYGRHWHRGRGYWHNGRWIALGVGAAIAGAAAASAYDDCYWRHGRRYCY